MKDLEKFKIIEECEKNAVPDSQIDTSEIPEVTDFSKFLSLSQHDKYFKPVKEQVSIRFYKVLLDHLRSKGRGWQSELNNFLMSAFLQGQI
ncbi:MAG: BrnA antitoxin family protein [Spirochaetia bacterium]|nr:BrnA antitoxin family protein [Spirochaetia bacterium]MBR0318003.1 BrnA antitoxin family protein [Spirochaetia bacterium]